MIKNQNQKLSLLLFGHIVRPPSLVLDCLGFAIVATHASVLV